MFIKKIFPSDFKRNIVKRWFTQSKLAFNIDKVPMINEFMRKGNFTFISLLNIFQKDFDSDAPLFDKLSQTKNQGRRII
jgi:hypothetical protein